MKVFAVADRHRDGARQLVGADAVGKVQSVIVVVLLIVFAVFIVATFSDADFELAGAVDVPVGHQDRRRPSR